MCRLLTSRDLNFLPFEDAQVQDVYDGQVAASVVAIVVVPFHTKQLNSCARYEEAEGETSPLRLLIPKVKSYAVDHWQVRMQSNKHRG